MRPVLIMNPPEDFDFREFVETRAADAADPGTLQGLLRVRYPMAVARARDLSSEQLEIWYVYREGRWVS